MEYTKNMRTSTPRNSSKRLSLPTRWMRRSKNVPRRAAQMSTATVMSTCLDGAPVTMWFYQHAKAA